MLGKLKRKKKKQKVVNPIHGFDYISFKHANNDLADYSDIEVDDYLLQQGLDELRSGKRKFHEAFLPYDDKTYLEHFTDLKEAVAKGTLKSVFHHFELFGYSEIIAGQREWIRNNDDGSGGEESAAPTEHFLIENVLREKIYKQFIDSLDVDTYLEHNTDILSAIENKTLKNLDIHFRAMGLEELYRGERMLMQEVGPYSDEVYCQINSDVKESLGEEGFVSGFEHFLIFGYKEVLSGKRCQLVEKTATKRNDDPFSINQLVIEQSGLFDEAFYLSTYPDVIENSAQPIVHYLRHGWEERRNPSDSFDTNYYMNNYPDVQNSGINPLVHYILVGQMQGRKTYKKGIGIGNMEFYHLPLVDQPIVGHTMKIAVVIHAFYIDVLEDIITSIDHISPRPDLFISVSEDAGVKEIELFLKDKGYMNFIIKPVQNRGRDVAPFLVEFSEALKSYDVCCKIHGKKSLYGGSEQTNWRNHLYHNLLGSKEIVNDILSAFSENKKLGLLFSDNYGMIPYWGYSWLTNKGVVNGLLQKLQLQQLSPILDQTYIDYPAGTMFWFRPEAISQILDGGLQYEDFPEEPIGNDGTVAHGLERLFGYVTRLNGYDYIEQNRKLMQYTKNVTHKNFNQHQAKTLDTAKRIVGENECVIFDIFDTLVTRTIFYPDNLFRILEERIDEKFDFRSNFMQIRKETENGLRLAGHDGDVSYEDIYNAMYRYSDYTPEMISYIRELDFACELEILKAKPEVVELLRHAYTAGIKVLFVSDMYLTKAQVMRILSNNDIPFEEENLLVSSDNGYRKDNTTVWRYLVEDKVIEPRKTLMIGDSEVSDAKIPGDFAIQSFHLLSERNNFFESPFGKVFTDKFPNVSQRDMILFGPIVNQVFASPFDLGSTLLDFTPKLSPYAFGYTALAPFFYLFLDNLYQKFSKEHIYFLARDGYFIKEAFEHFIQSKNLDPEGEIHYLEISRRAVLGAVKKDKENLKNMILDLGDYNGKLSDMIYSRVGLGTVFLEECGIEDFVISTHEDMETSYTLLVDNLDIINAHTQAEQKAFTLYLESIGFFDEREDVIVDLGYSGTIQNYLYQITGKKLLGEYFVTTDKIGNIENEENILHGYFAHKIDPKDMSDNIVYKYALILEGYLTSDKGQLICFEEQAGKAIPHYKVKKGSVDVQREITRGIKDYISDLSIVPVDFIDVQSDTNKEIALFPFEYMLKHRKLSEELLSIFHLEDEFTGVEKLDIMTILNQRGL